MYPLGIFLIASLIKLQGGILMGASSSPPLPQADCESSLSAGDICESAFVISVQTKMNIVAESLCAR